jgi:hypothetical protein
MLAASRRPEWRRAARLAMIAIGICLVSAAWFVTAATEQPVRRTQCRDRFGSYAPSHEKFETCIEANAAKFLKGDFAESKDLGKAFLTLLTAVFVGSITFSEKIVGIQNAGPGSRNAMITTWGAFLLALVACGCGLAFIALAAGIATYYPDFDYWRHEQRAIIMFGVSGVAFGAGLVALLVAGILSLFRKTAISDPSAAPGVKQKCTH